MIITSVIINHQIRRSALYGMGIRVRDVASRAAVSRYLHTRHNATARYNDQHLTAAKCCWAGLGRQPQL